MMLPALEISHFSGLCFLVSLNMVYSLRSETSCMGETMESTKEHLRHLASLFWTVFGELGDYGCQWLPRNGDAYDFKMISTEGQEFVFDVKVRERVTPQMADDLFARIQALQLASHVTRLVYAPVISPRVAEIARRHGISYMDYAGNCHIVNPVAGLFISRSGIPNDASSRKQRSVDPFSPKSSRIVRVMLHEPDRGWQVSELAAHPDVDVSAGLVSKVKQALVRESHAVVRDRLLYLKRPLELLAAWTGEYPGPSSQRQFYMRGDTEEVESRMSDWCEKKDIEYALARFSAAWRHAPEVRYSVTSLYVSLGSLGHRWLELLRADCGVKEVESGANLVLLTPFDKSVFVRRMPAPEQTTSPLQTYLDLQSMAGRGSEAAQAVFEKHLRAGLESAHGEGDDA